jgi:allantoin racemase
MGLKILLQNIMHEEEMGADSEIIWDGLVRLAKKVVRPDTAVTLRHLKKDRGVPDSLNWPWPLTWPCTQPLREAAIVNSTLKAEEEGFDAVVVDCALDPGLRQARGMLNIPITGAGESGLLIAQLLGRKFAIVAPSDTAIAGLEENLHFLGFGDRAIKHRPVRHFEIVFGLADAFRGKPKRLIEDFEKVAWELIRDGADVIVNACGLSGPAFSLNGYVEVPEAHVPVVDATTAALKLAELLADLQKSLGLRKTTLPTGFYRTPPKEVWDETCRRLKKALA